MEHEVEKLFKRYEDLLNRSLHGDTDMDGIASLYAAEFIGAAPSGVRAGKNDHEFRQVMAQGHAHYRNIGTREMRIRNLNLSPIDQYHCLAHVAWTATYARADKTDTVIDFDVHYFVQALNGEAKVFGWVSGDEQAVLEQHGIL